MKQKWNGLCSHTAKCHHLGFRTKIDRKWSHWYSKAIGVYVPIWQGWYSQSPPHHDSHSTAMEMSLAQEIKTLLVFYQVSNLHLMKTQIFPLTIYLVLLIHFKLLLLIIKKISTIKNIDTIFHNFSPMENVQAYFSYEERLSANTGKFNLLQCSFSLFSKILKIWLPTIGKTWCLRASSNNWWGLVCIGGDAGDTLDFGSMWQIRIIAAYPCKVGKHMFRNIF